MEQNNERWRQLCEQASTERNSRKLAELIKEIACLLDEKSQKKPNENGRSRSEQAVRRN
jgi:hypothetical protein